MTDVEELYSRQIAAYGETAMSKISKLKVLLYGLRGLGIEICKNIILAGIEKLTIFDNNKISKNDFCSNFYLEDKDIGYRRDEKCINKLSELNNYVICDYLKEGTIENNLQYYDILVITEILDIEYIKKLNEICHKKGKGFIYCLSLGLSFYCFVDFQEHTINNKEYADIKKYYINEIIQGKPTKIIIDNEFNDFQLNDGDFVIFNEIKGMNNILNGKIRKITNCDDISFDIEDDSTNYEEYIQGGVVEEVVENEVIKFKSFEEMLNLPEQCEHISEKNSEMNKHLAFISIHEFYKIYKKLPESNEDLEEILKITKNIYESNKNQFLKDINLEEDLFKNIYKFSRCEISPVCGYGGGVVSQEIIKYIGIYKPINQWFRADFYGILNKNLNSNIEIKDSRYHDQLLIFGNEAQRKLENLNIFMIGAGAVGCELLKYFSMMGIATNPNSLLTVTDHDRIEKSNLSRQFLFREKDIGKLKSEIAINSIKNFNNKINCVALEEFVNEQTEKMFNKEFFEKQSAVVICVDNFEARTYISNQCEIYEIPYFNCGTDGAYANVEAFIPGKTEIPTYPTDENKVVPSCTLKMYPSSIDHCILWSLNHFEKFFNKNIIDIKNLNYDQDKFYKDLDKDNIFDLRLRLKRIKKIFKFMKIANSKNFDKCIKYSIKKFYKFFIWKINSILKFFPPDKINKETGQKFWRGNKIIPHPLQFDINQVMCFNFIKSFSLLLAYCLDIDIKNKNIDEYIKKYSKEIKIKIPKTKNIEDTSYYEKEINIIDEKINSYLNENKNKINYKPIKYEKDTSDINQINFICNSSNLRASNYNIKNLDNIKIKIIAGKIVPSIITSTSAIAGLLALQLYVIAQSKDCKKFRTGMMDLSDNTLALGIPLLINNN